MIFSSSEIDKLGNTIIYLTCKIPDLSKTKLLKLLYLLEHCSVRLNKVPFMNLEFEVWQAGPVSKDVFVDLSNDEQSLLKDYVKMETKPGMPGTYVKPLREFCDDEFSDNDMELMDSIIKKFGEKTATELVSICHKENRPWYQIAQEKGILNDFQSGCLTSSDYKIDLSDLLEGCDKDFYLDVVDFNNFGRTLKR